MSRIIYVVNSLNVGGTENLVAQMSKAFHGEHIVSVICLDEPGRWAGGLRSIGVDVNCLWRQPGLDFRMAAKIAGFCRQQKVDLIHAHQCTAWFYSALSRLFFGRPKLLFEEHGRHYPEILSRKKNVVNKIIIQSLTHRIVAVSQDVKMRLVAYEGISNDRIDVIYNGVRNPSAVSDERRRELRGELGLEPDDFIIGSVGRLDAIKNIPLLLRAFQEAGKTSRKLKLMLVGDGPEKEALSNLVGKLQIEKDVVFTGYRKDATDLLQCMDAFVLCSFSEGTSMALLEAMAAGVPVIVTDVGGNPELVEQYRNGWVVPSGSEERLKTAIRECVGNDALRQEMAEKSRAIFATTFTFDRMIDNYRSLYLKMIGP